VPSGSSDIEPVQLELDCPEMQALSEWLSSAYSATERASLDAIQWYIHKKRSKSRWSRVTRSLAIALGVVGALVPLVSPVISISLAWGYTALGLAGGCVALDKLFGFSSSWMRYIQAEFELQHLLQGLQYAWMRSVCSVPNQGESRKAHEDTLASLLASHSNSVASIIRSEICP